MMSLFWFYSSQCIWRMEVWEARALKTLNIWNQRQSALKDIWENSKKDIYRKSNLKEMEEYWILNEIHCHSYILVIKVIALWTLWLLKMALTYSNTWLHWQKNMVINSCYIVLPWWSYCHNCDIFRLNVFNKTLLRKWYTSFFKIINVSSHYKSREMMKSSGRVWSTWYTQGKRQRSVTVFCFSIHCKS